MSRYLPKKPSQMAQVDGVQAAFSNAAEAVRRLLETLQQTQQTNQHTPENIVRCIVTQLQPIMTPELTSSTENSTVSDSVKKPKVEIKKEPEISEQEREMDHPSETDHIPTDSSQTPSDSLHEASIDSFHQISSDLFRVDKESGIGTPAYPSNEVASRSLQMNASLQIGIKGCPANQVSPYLIQIEEVYLPPKEPRLTPAEDTLRLKYRRFREKKFVCQYCNHTFTLKHNMRAHIANYHSAGGKTLQPRGKRYKCLKCGWLYRTIEEVQRHQRREHEAPRERVENITCEFCKQKFMSQNQLREHCSIVHLNQRPYECSICKMTFARKGGLNRHNLTVHSDFVYNCPYEGCTHAGYKCSKALSAHIRSVHTHIRPYKCEQCGKSFVRRNDLRTHETMHLANWDFVCETCGQKFRCAAYLKRHSKSQHGAIYAADHKKMHFSTAFN
uniref:C2H2-type domain-containing protein n=1 Tax=Parascaris univalens TaxID=6257 RepID=A0A915C034_PARUN